MANSLKGEVSFDAGGNTWVLSYPINSIIALEDALGVTVSEVGNNMGLRSIRTVFWAGLQARHDVTEDEAGDLIDAIGLTTASDLIGRAFALAFPGGSGKARPQKAAAGIGKPA